MWCPRINTWIMPGPPDMLREDCTQSVLRPPILVNFLRDATELSIVTNSDDLADYYFRRWSDAAGMKEVAQWFKWDSLHPEVQEWKQRHAPNPPAKKAR